MRAVVFVAVAALMFQIPAAAYPCEPTTTEPLLTTTATGQSLSGDGDGVYYLDHEGCILPWGPGSCHGYYWLYEESNGIDGLQRQDYIVDDTCDGRIAGDTLVLNV